MLAVAYRLSFCRNFIFYLFIKHLRRWSSQKEDRLQSWFAQEENRPKNRFDRLRDWPQEETLGSNPQPQALSPLPAHQPQARPHSKEEELL